MLDITLSVSSTGNIIYTGYDFSITTKKILFIFSWQCIAGEMIFNKYF